jgi:hypothetical protein
VPTQSIVPRIGEIKRGRIMSFGKAFWPEKIPSLSRIPKERGREERVCESCGTRCEHIYYQVPKKVAFLYFKDHRENLHATCTSCARSAVITGEEREKILGDSGK